MRAKLSRKKLSSNFVKKVEEISGQNLRSCYQCGKCSAGCPLVHAMDLLPNQIIRLVQLGLEEEIEKSKSIWLCGSCVTCGVRCPRGVDLSKIMEALRQLTLRKNRDMVTAEQLAPEKIADMPQIALVSCMRKLTG
ncbi:MAG: heterodisulfide reductase [Deltaproteobacteria bacterium]|nr:heterodisulfide reductase [Deltaproteobacteria bacterium]